MQKRSLIILFLTMFFIMLGFGIIIPHLAYYADDLGASPTQIGGLIAVYSAMQLIFAPMWGRMSDRRGRKPAILIGLIGNAIALALFGAAKTLPALFTARGLSGVLSAAVLPTVMAYVADVTTAEERGKGMGLMGAAMGLGFVFGPGIGGVMEAHNTPFFVAAGLSFLTFIFAWILLPESLKPREREKTDEPRLSLPQLFALSTRSHPLTPLFLVAFFTSFIFSGLEATFPLFITDQWRYGAKEMGWMFMIMGGLVALLQGGVLGRLINRFGEFKLIMVGLGINALGLALLPWSSGFATLTIYLTIAGVGNQIIRPTNTSWISKQTEMGQGLAIGLMDAFLSFGRVLGPPFAGKLFDGRLYTPETFFKLPYSIIAGMLLLASVCLFFPLRRLRGKKRNVD
jgi:MFS transporter, DHA1 family, multidrug resistance protein